MKKVSNIVSIILLCILTVSFVIVYLPRIIGLSGFYVQADSMEPTLKKGTLVFVQKCEFDEIKLGDIITFRNEESTKWCTHRVTEVVTKDKSFKTKGDNNNIADPFRTSYSLVEGKVVKSIPFIGKAFEILNNTVARIVVVVLAVVYSAIEIELIRNKKKERIAQ